MEGVLDEVLGGAAMLDCWVISFSVSDAAGVAELSLKIDEGSLPALYVFIPSPCPKNYVVLEEASAICSLIGMTGTLMAFSMLPE